ncbi:MAG: YhgE/Pip domain-containing protein [Firmicutes bacterium]|nr:YhgE/Pip domain-containing protein [Bacillota bacterium]
MVVAIAIVILPSLYAWLNIYSNWDPYGNTGGISIAVASLDEDYTTPEGETVNKGRDVLDDLRESTSINWVVVDTQDEAVEGVRAGDYYAAVVIGEDFTYNMYNMLTQWTGKPTITYYENDKKNAVATKITDTAASNLKQSITENYLEVLIGNIFRDASDLSQALTADDPVGSAQGLLTQANTLLLSLNQTLQAYANAGAGGGMDSALSQEVSDLVSSMNSHTPSTGDLTATVSQISREIYAALQKADSALQQAYQALETAVNGGNNEAALAAADRALSAAAQELGKAGQAVSDWGHRFDGQTGSAAQAAQKAAQELSEQLFGLQAQLNSLPGLVESKDDALAAVKSCVDAVDALTNRVGDLLTPSQSDLAQDIKDVAGQAEGMLDGLKGTAADVRTLLSQAQGLQGSLDSVLADGQAAISDASAKLTELIENLDLSGTQTQLSTLVDILGGDPAVYGQYFSELVQTSVEPVYPVANYGSAMAPFYSVLAIWVGGVILVALMKVHAKPDGLLDPKPWHLYFGRYLTFLLFNELQAAVIVTGDLFILGVQCENIGMFYLTGALTSFVFSLLIYSLAISFGDVGKAVVVVVMVLQIAGSSGTFPIELLPQVYRKIYHFFPFPYAIDAVRECLCGMYGNTWLVQIGYLMLFAVAALIIGLFVRKPFIGLNAFVEEKLEESELF